MLLKELVHLAGPRPIEQSHFEAAAAALGGPSVHDRDVGHVDVGDVNLDHGLWCTAGGFLASYTPLRPYSPAEGRILARVQAALAEQAAEEEDWNNAAHFAGRAKQTLDQTSHTCLRCRRSRNARAWLAKASFAFRDRPMDVSDRELALRLDRVFRAVRRFGDVAKLASGDRRTNQEASAQVLCQPQNTANDQKREDYGNNPRVPCHQPNQSYTASHQSGDGLSGGPDHWGAHQLYAGPFGGNARLTESAAHQLFRAQVLPHPVMVAFLDRIVVTGTLLCPEGNCRETAFETVPTRGRYTRWEGVRPTPGGSCLKPHLLPWDS